MNNLKFRAYIKSIQKIVDVTEIDLKNKMATLDIATNEVNPDFSFWWKETELPFSDIVIMQSTGLFDKNEVEIYEGDIIDVGTRIPFLNKIQRDEETAYLKLVPLDKRWTESYFTNFEDKSRYEVVGNIYENKELLK
nr:MAG TPA: YopX protein [Caudoviricetes sp.]